MTDYRRRPIYLDRTAQKIQIKLMLATILSARQLSPVPVRRTESATISALLLGAMSILMVFDTGIESYFFIILFGDAALGPSLMICFCIIVCFAATAFFYKEWFILAVFAATIAFVLSYYLYFIIGANWPLTFNPLGAYYGWLMIIVFYVLAKNNLLPVAMRFLFYIYTAYLVLYIFLSGLASAGLLSGSSEKISFIYTDAERGTQLIMHSLAAAAPYVATYSIARLQEKFRLPYIAAVGLVGYALYLSQARGLIICSGAVILLYIVTQQMRLVQYFSLITFLLVALYLSVGVFEPWFNPYEYNTLDTSAIARSHEYQIAVRYIREYPFFGVGIPDAAPGLIAYIGDYFYPDDLGIIGNWFLYGLFGVGVIFIFVVYLPCMQNIKRSSAILGVANARTLSLTGCILSLYSVTMGGAVVIGSSLVLCLIVANTLYSSRHFVLMERRPRLGFARKQFRPFQHSRRTRRPPDVELSQSI